MKILANFLDFIFPPICGICNKIEEKYICENCYKEIEKYLYNNIDKDIFYLLKYEDTVRKKMIEYKFNDKSYLYKTFCEIFVKNKNAFEFCKSYDIIIPVPMYKKKKRLRGYNQTELIAKKIANILNIQIGTNILIKYKNTLMQSSLGKEERVKNVQNAYKIQNEERIIDKKVLILDDIYTTGTTAKECKNMLLSAGAKEVGIFIIAKD